MNYIKPHIEGGPRRTKGSEISMKGKGCNWWRKIHNTFYKNSVWTRQPQPLRQCDQGQHAENSEWIAVAPWTPIWSAVTAKVSIFCDEKKGGGGASGIWERRGKTLKKLFNVVDSPQYRKRFHFYRIAESSALEHFNRNFVKALNQTLITAI